MNEANQAGEKFDKFHAPHPGSRAMPRWDSGQLPDAPKISLRSWALLLGPGLVAAGAAIGGGEWLAGPLTTARYGGAILWLSTISIVVQLFYNLEISRYTLYSGEPIFTGKFRLLPGPMFWLVIYLMLDFGSLFPYLVSSAATPIASILLGQILDVKEMYDLWGMTFSGQTIHRWISYGVFLTVLTPLIFGGKVYNSLKAIMAFKIVVVFGFLLLVAIFFSKPQTWIEIFSGFLKFGSVPVAASEAGGAAGTENLIAAWWQGRPLPEIDLTMIAVLGALAAISGNGGLTNTALSGYTRDQGWGMGKRVGAIPSVVGGQKFKLSHVGMVFDVNRESVRPISPLVSFHDARPAMRVDARLLRRHRAAEHAVRSVPAARTQGRPMGRRRHDGRRLAQRGRSAVGTLLLADDVVLRVSGFGAGCRHHH